MFNKLSQDDNKRIKALLSFVLIILFWLSAGVALTIFFRTIITSISPSFAISTYYRYIEINLSFFAMALGLYVSLKYIMNIRLRQLVSRFDKYNRMYLLIPFVITIIALILYLVIGSISGYKEVAFNDIAIKERLIFLVIILILTPFQCFMEEILYRGVLLRAIVGEFSDENKLISIIASIIVAIAFTLPHLSNPEVASYNYFPLIYYFIFGFLTSIFTLHYKSVEIAIAVHSANNLFVALICNYPSSALSSQSLFLETQEKAHYFDYLVLLLIFLAIYIALKKVSVKKKDN